MPQERERKTQSDWKMFNNINAFKNPLKICQHKNQPTSATSTITGAPSCSEWKPGTLPPQHLQAEEPQSAAFHWWPSPQWSCSWNIWLCGLLHAWVKPRLSELRWLLPSARLVLSPRRPWSVSGISRPSCPGFENSISLVMFLVKKDFNLINNNMS